MYYNTISWIALHIFRIRPAFAEFWGICERSGIGMFIVIIGPLFQDSTRVPQLLPLLPILPHST